MTGERREKANPGAFYQAMFDGVETVQYPVGDRQEYTRGSPPVGGTLSDYNLESYLPRTNVPIFVVAGTREKSDRRIYRIMAGVGARGRITHVTDADEQGFGYGYIGGAIVPTHEWQPGSVIEDVKAIYKPGQIYYLELDDEGDADERALNDVMNSGMARMIARNVRDQSPWFSYDNTYLFREIEMQMVAGPGMETRLPEVLDENTPYIIQVRSPEKGERILVLIPKKLRRNSKDQAWRVYDVREGDRPGIYLLNELPRVDIARSELYFRDGTTKVPASEGHILALYRGYVRPLG